jgi:cation:H+ antiporter
MQNMEVRAAALGSLMALSAMTVLTLVFLRSGWQLTRREGVMLILVGAFRWALDFMPQFLH